MKNRILAVALMAALVPAAAVAAGNTGKVPATPAPQQQQLWAAWGGTVEVRWNRDLASDLGIRISPASEAMPELTMRGRDEFVVRREGSIEFHVLGGYFRGFDGGFLQAAGGYTMTLPGGDSIDYTDFRLVPNARDPLVLDFVGRDGATWFYIDRLMYELLDDDSVLAVGAMDMRISPALARRIGHPEVADWPIADLAMTTEVQTQGSGAMPLASNPHWPGDSAPNGGRYEADLFMQTFSMSYSRCSDCNGNEGTGRVAFTPSSTLRNNVNAGTPAITIPGQTMGTSSALWAASIPWNQKFTGNHAPYGNDQHPYLIWNMYRINGDGVIEQIGRSGVKHAWLTTNGGCMDPADHDNHILGRGCSDTYGTGNNDTSSDLGPRSEIVPAAGLWGRCGSIYDPNCVGSMTVYNPNTSWDQRMVVREQQISPTKNPDATYLFESWYIARDDINPYNSMATITGRPAWTGSTWSPGGGTGYTLGPAIDRWVDPQNPGTNARNVELATTEGRVKVAVKATATPDGMWRYDYAVMNVDFARAVTSGTVPNIRVESNQGFDGFSVPVPVGSVVSALPGRVGEIDPGYSWRASIANARAVWSTDTSLPAFSRPTLGTSATPRTLDWGVMYSFTLISDKAPVAGSARLDVAGSGSPDSYEVDTLIPGA